jgi:hypothetical protein
MHDSSFVFEKGSGLGDRPASIKKGLTAVLFVKQAVTNN